MNHLPIIAILIAVLAVAIQLPTSSAKDEESAWKDFLGKYKNKINFDKDALKKNKRFKEVHQMIERHNQDRNATFFLEHNEFSVLDETEKKQFLMDEKTVEKELKKMHENGIFNKTFEHHGRFRRAIPTSFDYRGNSCLGGVKNQGRCGSCWAFAAIASLEYFNCVQKGRVFTYLSEQQLVDCDGTSFGCNGGYSDNAWAYLRNAGGSDTSSSYPYTAVQGTCKFNPNTVAAKVGTIYAIGSVGASLMQQYLVSYGPLVTYFTVANNFQYYGGGVYRDATCTSQQINHAMNIVGYGKDTASGLDYWVVRNSWGNWGQGGYILVQRGVNMCNIEKYVYFLG